MRCHIQHNSYVQWKNHDDDIAKGEIGQVVGSLNDEGKVGVSSRWVTHDEPFLGLPCFWAEYLF